MTYVGFVGAEDTEKDQNKHIRNTCQVWSEFPTVNKFNLELVYMQNKLLPFGVTIDDQNSCRVISRL
jgi:hypothetical protein